ncbi:MAG: ABC transporter permease [Deltaproteobacteria bacterium]|nr:ABC transporter permease [Deltaproteobacteria bacterium]
MNLRNLLRHISLKHIRLQKAQLFIAISGICLGVAAMVSIDIVNKSVIHSFEDSISQVTGRATLQITEGESGFPEKLLDLVQNVSGVEYAVPVIETNANLTGGSERSLMILGVDVLQDHKIRDYSIRDETADIPDPLLFLAKSDSILLTRAMAEREGIKMDQGIRLQTVQGIKTFYVRGLLDPEGPARVAGGDIAVMDIYAAQMVFGKEGRIDRIDVSFLPGETLDAMKERIQRLLPEGYSVDTPAARTRQVEILLNRFQKATGFISLMAMFIGMYLIYNAVSISVVQRRREIGILRALGTKRSEIISLFLGETVAFSAIGSALGIGLGFVFAKLTIGAVSQTVSEAFIRTSVTALSFSWETLVRDVGFGILASLSAAAFPAISSVRITPVSAIRAVPYSEDGFMFGKRVKIAVALFISLAVLNFAAYKTADASSSGNYAFAFASGVFLLVGISILAPVFLKWFITFFHRFISSGFGAAGRLAGMNLQKNISRNGVAISAILGSIALFVGSADINSSFQDSVFEWMDSVLRADILVSSGHLVMGGSLNIPMPGETLKEIERIPGVRSVEPFRRIYLNYDGRKTLMESVDVAYRMGYCPFMIAEGNREDMLRLLPRQDNIAINEAFAARNRIKPGDSLDLSTPNGPVRFGVAAVIVSYASDSGTILMDIHTYRRHWQDNLVDKFDIRVKSKEDISSVCRGILDRMGKERKLFVLSSQEFKEEVRKVLDRSFVVTNATNVLMLIIAGFGIIVTLLASVLERTREIGVLRSIGMKRSQVSGVIIIESAIIGIVGGLLGCMGGILFGWIGFDGFLRFDFGASISYHIHYASLAWALLLSGGLSAMAGLYPARRAAKTNIVEALSYE